MMDERERLGRVVRGFAPPDDAFERLVARKGRKQRNQRLAAGAVGVIVALVVGIFLVKSLTSNSVPANPPVEPTPVPAGSAGRPRVRSRRGHLPRRPGRVERGEDRRPRHPRRRVRGDRRVRPPSWSPDGRYLAYQGFCTYSSYTDPSAVVITYADGTVIAEIRDVRIRLVARLDAPRGVGRLPTDGGRLRHRRCATGVAAVADHREAGRERSGMDARRLGAPRTRRQARLVDGLTARRESRVRALGRAADRLAGRDACRRRRG